MKKLIFSIFSAVIIMYPVLSDAQKEESKASQKTNAYEMNINGVKVVVQGGGNDILVVQTIIKGGVENYAVAKAGIENLALTALTECGTAKDDKNSFKNKLDKVSAEMDGSSGMDYATFTMNCIKNDFATVWPLYVDALTAPRFDQKEFNRIRQDAINEIKANESNPDFAIDKMAKQNAFAGKSYAKDPNGTVETVGKLTAPETKSYWQSICTRSRMLIVIVGDLDSNTIKQNVSQLLSKVPQGLPFKQSKSTYSPAANTFKPQPRDNATNYVQGISAGPQPGTPDFNAFLLAMRVFSSRHFVEIRSKNGLSYAPGAWLSQGNTTYSNIYVTTTDPDKYIAVARQLIDKIKKEGFTEEELKNIKTQYLTNVYYRQETNDAQAGSLAFNEVVHGDWRRANTIQDDVKKVTLDDMNNAFRKYISNITWSYQGDPKKVTAAMYTQKETPAIPAEKKAF
ncbi:MAG: insulinase family protein [Sphingobacteriales bacterium]|nr:insulinase family protein [Sphingobacteriales bacterium]